MRDWTERHIRELIKKTYREIKDDKGNYKKKEAEELKGSYMHILGRGAYVKHLPTWGIGNLLGYLKFVILPHKKYSGGVGSPYEYFGTEPILAFSLTSVTGYNHVEGKPDFIFINDRTRVKGGFGFNVPATLPGPLNDLATMLATLFGDADNGVYLLDTDVPLGNVNVYNSSGERKSAHISTAGSYDINNVYLRDTKYTSAEALNAFYLDLSEVLSDRSFGTDFIMTTAEMTPETARQIYQEVFNNDTETRTYSVRHVDLFKLLYGGKL